MCCVISVILLIGPRAGILIWWLLNPVRFNVVFDTLLWPILGFIFLPFTTLAALLVYRPLLGGWVGLDWLWIALGVLMDLSAYGGGIFSRRNR